VELDTCMLVVRRDWCHVVVGRDWCHVQRVSEIGVMSSADTQTDTQVSCPARDRVQCPSASPPMCVYACMSICVPRRRQPLLLALPVAFSRSSFASFSFFSSVCVCVSVSVCTDSTP